MDQAPQTQSGFERGDVVRLVALVVVLLVVSGAIALFASGGGADGSGEERGEVTGVITTVTQDRLVLRPLDGTEEQTFAIRGVDARRLDLFHLRQHSAQNLPTRVVWFEDGGTRYALEAVDAVPAP